MLFQQQLSRRAVLAFIFLSACVATSTAIDLCLFLGICNNNNNNNNNNFNIGRVDGGNIQPAVFVDGEWLEPQNGANGKVYLFATDVASMDWYEADRYCEQKGGYLAEPLSSVEHQFLVSQARRLGGGTNWWLGLREAEACNCVRTGDARSSPAFNSGPTSFEASLDLASLSSRSASGYVRTSCPVGYAKRCSGQSWRWAFSGKRVSSAHWNRASGEPNGGSAETCVTMWVKGDFSWGDWRCTIRTDSGHNFRPLCEKEKFVEADYDYDYDSVDNHDGDRLPKNSAQISCLDADYAYTVTKRQKLDVILGVGSHQECRRQCARNTACQYWTWRGDKRMRKCILSSGVASSDYKKPKPEAYSGSMLSQCRSGVSTQLSNKITSSDHCVEYGVVYQDGNNLRFLNNIDSAEKCRTECLSTDGCGFWTWRGDARQKRCFLKAAEKYQTLSKRGVVSGSVLGQCRDNGQGLDAMRDCDCADAGRRNNGNNKGNNNRRNNRDRNRNKDRRGDDSSDDSFDEFDYDLDLVGEGLIDVRINDNPTGVVLLSCRKNQIRRCRYGNNDNSDKSKFSGPFIAGKEVCADYDMKYSFANVLSSSGGAPNADVCRARCVQRRDECRAWTWSGRRCKLFSSPTDRFVPAYSDGAVSGTLDGSCIDLALSQLRKCVCKDPVVVDDYFDDYDDTDLVGEGFIDVRQFTGGNSACPVGHGLRCYADEAAPVLRSRINLGGQQQRDASAVIFRN